jgi:hypothetical protein
MVRFQSNPESFNTARVLCNLERDVVDCMALDKKITGLDDKITLNPNYIKKAANNSAAAAAAGTPIGGAGGLTHRWVLNQQILIYFI